MKLDQKIYKAIQKGLAEALDFSFDDDIDLQNIPRKTNALSKLPDAIYIQDNFVDLGLQSGTLWMKHNLGATCEDTPESWYGDCFAWGELEPKEQFESSNYTYRENPELLPLDHDIAYQINNLICMPTIEQFKELMDLEQKWVTNYNGIKDLNGILLTGTNGNILFIPASGNSKKRQEYEVDLWSRNRHASVANAYMFHGWCTNNSLVCSRESNYFRFKGTSIRAVKFEQ